MSAHTGNSQFPFQLPSLSYIDAKWEEPNLRSSAVPAGAGRKTGVAAWLSRQFAAFSAWRLDRQAAVELAQMSDRELLDIGLNRSDVGRVFTAGSYDDLLQRGR